MVDYNEKYKENKDGFLYCYDYLESKMPSDAFGEVAKAMRNLLATHNKGDKND